MYSRFNTILKFEKKSPLCKFPKYVCNYVSNYVNNTNKAPISL